MTIIMDHTVVEQPAAILVNHHQTGILQTSQSCGIRSMSVEDDLGIWSGPPDPQMDAGSWQLRLPISFHHLPHRIQSQEAGGGHLAPVHAGSSFHISWSNQHDLLSFMFTWRHHRQMVTWSLISKINLRNLGKNDTDYYLVFWWKCPTAKYDVLSEKLCNNFLCKITLAIYLI